MVHSIGYFVLLAVSSGIAGTPQQLNPFETERTILADCISTVDFIEPFDDLPTECKQSFESLLPSQANIVRFLAQFDPNVQPRVQQVLKETFVAMARNGGGGVLTYGGYSETDTSRRVPSNIPDELRYEILHHMQAGQGGPIRVSPALRDRLHSYRNVLLKQGNYAAAYWIDRLLRRPDPPVGDGTVIGTGRKGV